MNFCITAQSYDVLPTCGSRTSLLCPVAPVPGSLLSSFISPSLNVVSHFQSLPSSLNTLHYASFLLVICTVRFHFIFRIVFKKNSVFLQCNLNAVFTAHCINLFRSLHPHFPSPLRSPCFISNPFKIHAAAK